MILNRQREVRLERRALESFLRRVKRELGLAKADLTVCLVSDKEISPATARRYARKNARRLGSELRVLTLHGVLHLLGYDHEIDHGEMERLEQKLRKRLGIV